MNYSAFLRFLSRTEKSLVNNNKCYSYRQFQPTAKRFLSGYSISNEEIEEKQLFRAALPGIIDNLKASPYIARVPQVGEWLQEIIEYHVKKAYHTRGILMFSYEMLERPENITEEKIKLSRVLGWCVEMAQGVSIIADDMVDASTMRGGIPCWHCLPNVGMSAVNDLILMNCCLTETIEKYFKNTSYYTDVVQLFNEAIFCTAIGVRLDVATSNQKDYSLFTMEHHNTIFLHKTAYIGFRLPIMVGLKLVNDVDKSMYDDIDLICMDIALLYTLQNDYLDCYGDVAVTGKVGTDIQEGKCSWLAVTAYQLCNKEQKELFAKYFHHPDPRHVAIIKNLYNELNIPERLRQKENEIRHEIMRRAASLPLETAPKFFEKLLERLTGL